MATVNKIQKASDTTTVQHLTDSQILDDGTNVGVGTTSPGSKLDVAGSGAFSGPVKIGATSFLGNENLKVQNDADGYQLVVQRNNSGKLSSIGIIADNSNAVTMVAQGGSARGGIDSNATLIDNLGSGQNGINFRLNGTCKMRLDSGGKVGIGTTTPQEALQVNGNIRIDDGTGYPGFNRVATTQKVYNVLDYGAIPLFVKVWSLSGTISSSSANTLTDSSITMSNVSSGDTLWIHNNQNCGAYTVRTVVDGTITINGSFNNYSALPGNVSWKVTSAATTVDNTLAFNNALSAASAEGGGVVYVPNGYYVFNNNSASILVPSNVILRGMRSAPPVWMKNFWIKGTPQGPVLLCLSNFGSSGGPSFIILSGGINDPQVGAINGSSVIEGLTIFYPVQYLSGATQGTSFNVQPYPYCIEFQANTSPRYSGKGCDNRAMNLTLVNPYQGISMVAQAVGGRNHLYNIYGFPLQTGILVDNMGDVTIIEKVFFNPSYFNEFDWTSSDQQRKDWYTYLVQNMTAIIIQQANFLIIKDFFAIFAHNGIWISSDSTTGPVQGLFGTNIQFDMADCGIYVDIPAPTGAVAEMELSNVRITCGNVGNVNSPNVYNRNHCIFGDSSGNHGGAILLLNTGVFQSWLGGNTILWQIPGCLKIANFVFIDYTQAITAGVNATAGRIQIHGCLFQHNSTGFINCINIATTADVGMVYGNDYRDNAPGANSAVYNRFNVIGNVGLTNVVPISQVNAPTFTGPGLNDMTASGIYTGQNGNTNYRVQIETVVTGSITAFANGGTNLVNATSNNHGLSTGNEVTISGPNSYNGVYVITRVDQNTFQFSGQFSQTGTGNWEKTNTFRWSDSGGGAWNATGVQITGFAQTFNNGVQAGFNSKSGHTVNSHWDFVASVPDPFQVLNNTSSSLLMVKIGGNVGIGLTNPVQKLDVNGTIHASNLNSGAAPLSCDSSGNIIKTPSDKRLKKNIRKIEHALGKVMKLRGVAFDWKKEANMGVSTYGLIAQEVRHVLPELVTQSEKGMLGVNYPNMVAVLIEAIKEQQNQMLSLKKEFDKLNKKK